ncbi:MAG: 4-hydroxybenzoate octaprenyltransferase [Proteobacteria bacterium]|nr:4-hydroxybenzoate octaprenyltransferase [Pseudomonadota bacterium]
MARLVDFELPVEGPGSQTALDFTASEEALAELEPPVTTPPEPPEPAPATRAEFLPDEPILAAPPPAAFTPAAPAPAVLAPAAASASHWLIPRLADFALLMRLDRPIGTWLLLWPTLWALWIASGGHPQPRLLVIFIVGTVLMRSAGCVVNDLWDRDIDPHVRRTRTRPLAARRVTPAEALALFAALLGAALLLVLQLNALCLKLAFIGAALTATYPLFKRFFAIPQLYLGLCFAWGVPMAYAAELGVVPRAGWVFMLAAVVWAGVYDTFYAMADRPDDLRLGLKSSAITFADMDLLMIGIMQLMVLAALLFGGRLMEFDAPYYWTLGVAAACFAWQQWLARGRDAEGCMAAFHNNNYVGVLVLAGVILQYSAQR